jgi:hypothetical protein
MNGCNRYRHVGQGVLTQADADAIIADAELPDGWRLETRPMRRYRYRCLWGLFLYDAAGTIVWKNAVYDLRGAVHAAANHARRESRPMVITTDSDGYVTSIEDAPEDWDLEGQPEFNGAFRG